jgi:predicted amidohydrolase YtcJ
MGVLSTMEITREDTLSELRGRLEHPELLTDDQLSRILEAFTSDRNLLNFSVVRRYGESGANYRYTEGCLD